jgi:nitrogen fixation/metabolism regulation signal transduction histidine kinase
LDPQKWQCVIGNQQIEKPTEDLVEAITEVLAGMLQPERERERERERENGELTRALGNPEHL